MPRQHRTAYENIRNLNVEISEFLDTAHYAVPATLNRKGVVPKTSDGKTPARIPVLIGEIAHNLRPGLNHLAGAIVVAGGGQITDDTEFPIVGDGSKYPTAVKRNIQPAAAP